MDFRNGTPTQHSSWCTSRTSTARTSGIEILYSTMIKTIHWFHHNPTHKMCSRINQSLFQPHDTSRREIQRRSTNDLDSPMIEVQYNSTTQWMKPVPVSAPNHVRRECLPASKGHSQFATTVRTHHPSTLCEEIVLRREDTTCSGRQAVLYVFHDLYPQQ